MYAVLKYLAVFAGLGSLFYVSGRSFLGVQRRTLPSTAIAAGLVLNILFAMITCQVVGALVTQALTTLLLWAVQLWRRPKVAAEREVTILGARFVLVLSLAAVGFLLLCVVDPIKDWDARSMWFYHAKVIYHTQSIWAGGAWAREANIYTHLNYPKLFSLLAAQVATLLGFWNEYAPKMAIALLALPMLAFYCEAWPRNAGNPGESKISALLYTAMLTLLIFGFDGSGFFLLNGYMDGWVALYICLATIAWAGAGNLGQAFVFLALVAELKQEGLILAAMVLLIGLALQARHLRTLRGSLDRPSLLLKVAKLAVLTLPIFAWLIAVKVQHLARSHYSGNTLERILARLSTPTDYGWILANILLHNAIVLPSLILALTLVIALYRTRRGLSNILLLPGLSAIAYCGVVFCVYLATNADLYWHLGASAGRVGLTPGLLLATFNMLAIHYLVCNKRAA